MESDSHNIQGLKMFNRADPVRIAEDAMYPVGSPDGRSAAFFKNGWSRVRRVSASGSGRRLYRGVIWDWTRRR